MFRLTWCMIVVYSFAFVDSRLCGSITVRALIDALHKSLHYMADNKSDLNIDSYFGIKLSYDQLKRIKTNDSRLQNIQNLASDFIKDQIRPGILKFSGKNILNTDIMIDADYSLKCGCNNLNHYKYGIISMILGRESSPNESQSDWCLTQLFNNANSIRDCRTAQCTRIMFVGDSEGYSTTHRLLYLLFYRALNCKNDFDFKLRTDELCCKIRNEQCMIKNYGYPDELRDLYIEQGVACGLSGYRDFMSDTAVNLVLNWQRSVGCWGYFNPRVKRSTTALGSDFCSSHMTSVAVVYLSLALRQCLN